MNVSESYFAEIDKIDIGRRFELAGQAGHLAVLVMADEFVVYRFTKGIQVDVGTVKLVEGSGIVCAGIGAGYSAVLI